MKDKKEKAEVVVTNVKMPFFSLMMLMVEIGLASIPAIFIVAGAYAVIMTLVMK